MNQSTVKRLMISRKNLALFKYIFESYENLVQISTVDPSNGLVEVYIPKGNLPVVENILSDLKDTLAFVEL